MSMNSEPIVMDLEALPEGPALDEVDFSDDDDAESRRDLSHSEYDSLEEAVMQTARGRTFLREHARRNRAIASDLVLRALDEQRSYLRSQEIKQPTDILAAELQDMSDAIKHTRRDIAAIKPEDGANNRIMAATEDLDAIVTATERATNDILTAAERIQETCETLREDGSAANLLDALEEDITNIFLACSFQDITGQRTTKVVNALHYLEQRVGAMIQIWGSESLRNGAESDFGSVMTDEDHPESGLLNGPQLEGQGVDQDDIDQLLNGDIEQVKAEADVAVEFAGEDDPTDGIEFDAVPAAADETADEAADEEPPADEMFAAASDGGDLEIDDEDVFAGLSEEADADTIDAIFDS